MTKVVNFKQTVALVADIASKETNASVTEVYTQLKPFLKRRIQNFTKAKIAVGEIVTLATPVLTAEQLSEVITLANAEANTLATTPVEAVQEAPAAEAKPVALKLVEDTPPNRDDTTVPFYPRKVANEVGTLIKSGEYRNTLLIYAFCDAVDKDSPVYGETAALELTNKWLALADKTIKHDVPLLTAIKEKIVEVHLSYIRHITKGY